MAPVELSIACFRYAPVSLAGDEARLDALNKAILERLQARGESFPSQTLLDGKFAIRANVMHYASTEAHIERLIEQVLEFGADLRGQNQ
jgi:aromatic-L-amino-acid decarboxylase